MGRKHKRTSLLVLPEHLLERIFASLVNYGAPLSLVHICKTTLRPALRTVYRDVTLRTSPQIARFCAALAVRPELAAAVEVLAVEDKLRPADVNESVWRWVDYGLDDLPPFFDGQDAAAKSYDPSHFDVGIGLVQDLLFVCHNVKQLPLIGEPLVVPLLRPDFLIRGPFRKLYHLTLHLDDSEDYNLPGSDELLPLLRDHVPSLEHLHLGGGETELPLDLLNRNFHVHLAPRSWDLLIFKLDGVLGVPAEFRNFLSAVTSLHTLLVRAHWVYRDFVTDLVRLPPTLRLLVIDIGSPCPGFCTKHAVPKLTPKTLSSLFFPDLDTLQLSGGVISTSALSLLSTHFPKLRFLDLGTHDRVTRDSILSLLPSVSLKASRKPYPRPRSSSRPTALPNLNLFRLNICDCQPATPRFSSTRRHPVWQPDFGYSDAKAVIAACIEAEIGIEGTILCAARSCPGFWSTEEHTCPMWYK
ncbi:hypothetical protein JCM8097_005286 [Rhodosporidiobolus ruineniae]